jgi:hypothetical protein
VRRHRDGDPRLLCGIEQFADVSDGVVLTDAVTEHRPRGAVGAEEVDLRIGDDERGVVTVQDKFGTGQRGVVWFGVDGGIWHDTTIDDRSSIKTESVV